MLLTVDAGNTNIAMGLMDGDDIKATYRLTTDRSRTSDEFGFYVTQFLSLNNINVEDIEDVIISSVVPKIMYSLSSCMIKYLNKEPMIVNHKLDTGIKLTTETPDAVGADRIVNTAYAYHTFHESAIIVDFGTATTFDYVNKEGEFKYVVIAPGISISANALTSQTAKLPEIEIQKPTSVLGTTTVSGMQAGVVYGYIGLVEKIIRQMKEELNDPTCKVIATGGLGRIIAQETDEIDSYDPNVSYKGMKIIYDRNKK